MDDTRVCRTCGKTYSKPEGWGPAEWKKRRIRCCSLACYKAAPTPKPPAPAREKPCMHCGEIFQARRNQHGSAWEKRLYCTVECFHAHLRAKAEQRFAHTRHCPMCGDLFTSNSPQKHTCGAAECRKRWRKEISGPALSRKMKADFASGARPRRYGRSKTELLVWEFLETAGWAWSLRWRDHWGAFELDFALPREQVAVELDGPAHALPAARAKDEARDAELARRGWRILRIPNTEVDADPLAVIDKIVAFAL